MRIFSSRRRIWFLTTFFVLIIACGSDNKKEIDVKENILKLSGPMAYKGLDNQVIVEGIVENISARSMEKITVIVSWYNQDKEFLSRMKKKIGAEILLPNKTLPYRLVGEFDPRMDNYNVGFYNKEKELLSVYHFQYIKP